MGFTKKILVNSKSSIYLVTGKEDGKDAWYYPKLDPLKASIFLKTSLGNKTKLSEYGSVLESGWGLKPPEKIKNKYK